MIIIIIIFAQICGACTLLLLKQTHHIEILKFVLHFKLFTDCGGVNVIVDNKMCIQTIYKKNVEKNAKKDFWSRLHIIEVQRG